MDPEDSTDSSVTTDGDDDDQEDDDDALDDIGAMRAADAGDLTTIQTKLTQHVTYGDSRTRLFSIWRAVLYLPVSGGPRTDVINDQDMTRRLIRAAASFANGTWVVLLVRGGAFAGCVYCKGQLLVHKTYHRYVLRGKAGGRQSTFDKQNASVAHSVGAQMRRHGEIALTRDIKNLLSTEWRAHIDTADALIIHAPGVANMATLFSGDDAPLIKSDGRIIRVPVYVKSANATEALRVMSEASSINFDSRTVRNLLSKMTIQPQPGEGLIIKPIETAARPADDVVRTISPRGDTHPLMTSIERMNAVEDKIAADKAARRAQKKKRHAAKALRVDDDLSWALAQDKTS